MTTTSHTPAQTAKLEAPQDSTVERPLRRIWNALKRFNSGQIELQERLLLINRPWEEEYLHWAFDGQQWLLHGSQPAPQGRRHYSVTSTGWCPGLSRRN